MANPDILFRGIPRARTRGYTANVIAAMRPEIVVVPCCGSFSLAVVAIEAGMQPSEIVCGDISLYSTALGYAIMDQDWRLELKDERGETVKSYLDQGPIAKAAAVFFMLRVLQYDRKVMKAWHIDHQRELLLNVDAYMLQLQEAVSEMRERLHGIEYHARDMWDTLEEHRQNPKAVLLTNPPRYDGGYDRMFAGIDAIFDWDEPEIGQFREADYKRLMDLLGESEAHTMMYYATQGEDPTPLWGEPWRAVFADRPGNTKRSGVNWIIANGSYKDHMIARTAMHQGKPKYPLFMGELSAESVLTAHREHKAVGDFYRDLFIHRIEGAQGEVYLSLLVDGYLLGVIGLHLQSFRSGSGVLKGTKASDLPVKVVFAFSVPHDVYARLHKLTLMSLLSSWLWDDCFAGQGWYDIRGCPRMIQ
ncbi:MAG: hypothetical protein GWN58_53980, partial [Anaerolineae bacterium]|nr:hypothetical protein [Anaerolineae bacterium]